MIVTGLNIADKRPLPNPTVSAHPLLDEMVLELPEREVVLSLNRSARAVWELCDGQRTVYAVAQALGAEMGELDTDAFESLLMDVETAVSQFQQHGLLTLEI